MSWSKNQLIWNHRMGRCQRWWIDFLPIVTKFLFLFVCNNGFMNPLFSIVSFKWYFLLSYFFLSQKRKLRKVLDKHMYNKEHISSSFLMPTLTSYFGFLLAVLTITAGLFISFNKLRLIWFEILRWIANCGIF